MSTSSLFLLLLLISISTISFSKADEADCVYTIYVRTGSIFKGGTDSTISVKLYDAYGEYIHIPNIEPWGGLMGPGYNYFERGNLDIFSGRGKCLNSGVCAINLGSDGSGSHHGWYCNYVEVTSSGVHNQCSQQQFEIEQWLATDAAPFQLNAIRNNCPYIIGGRDDRRFIKLNGESSLL